MFGGNLAFSNGPDATSRASTRSTRSTPSTRPGPSSRTCATGAGTRRGMRCPTAACRSLSGLDESGDRRDSTTDVEVFTPLGRMDGRGTVSLVGSQRPVRGSRRTAATTRTCSRCPRAGRFVAGPFRSDRLVPELAGREPFTVARRRRTCRKRRLWGTAVPAARRPRRLHQDHGARRQHLRGRSLRPPRHATTEVFDEAQPGARLAAGAADEHRPRPRQHRAAARRLDGRRSAAAWASRQHLGRPAGRPTEAQKQIELWDPPPAHWRLGPGAGREPRLPLDRDAAAGRARDLRRRRRHGAGRHRHRDTAEIYEPPYLFKGPRPDDRAPPRRRSGPARASTSDTPNANVTKARLIAPSAVTHAVDMNQRSIALAVTPAHAAA